MDLTRLYELLRKQKKDSCLSPAQMRQMRQLQYKMTQVEFAKLLEVPDSTYKQWEQGRYTPDSGSRKLLLIAQQYPDIFIKHRDQILNLFAN